MPLRVTAGAAACAAVLMIGGCASSSSSSSSGSSDSASGSSSPSGGGSGSAGSFKIGVTNPLTGPYAALGTGMTSGFKAAIQAANKAGGVDGRQIDVTYLDDADNPSTAISNATNLVGQGVLAISGSLAPEPCAAMLPVITNAHVPLVCGQGAASVVSSQWGFETEAPSSSFALPMFKFGQQITNMKDPRVGIINVQGAQTGAWAAAVNTLAQAAGSATKLEATDPANANVLAQMSQIASFKPDVVLFEDTEPHYVQLRQALATAGLSNIPILSYGSTPSESYLLQQKVGNLYVINDERFATDPANAVYKNALIAADVNPTNTLNADWGYVQGLVIVAALKKCGDGCTPSTMRDAIETAEVPMYGITAEPTLSFKPGDHQFLQTALTGHYDSKMGTMVTVAEKQQLGTS
jgi:branched-chain amino acid transport system substrate-binding protein